MTLTPIDMECYAGGKADETPRRFRLGDEWIEADEVLDRGYQMESLPGWPRSDYFKVRDARGRVFVVKHDLQAGEWFLVKTLGKQIEA